jgi:epoxyqueuosine reductase
LGDISLADELCRLGRQAGLDAVGICDATPFADTRRVILDRRARGWSAGMQFTYRKPGRATDPQATLPGAAALLVGARRYERAEPAEPAGERTEVDKPAAGDARWTTAPARPAPPRARPPRGRVAMYSWIDHYRPLRAALGVVAEHLMKAGWRAQVLADDNALVDRAAAVRAGLGWYGKNTNVLLPGAGSWFVLGSVLTDAPLMAGRPALVPIADGCQACRRCLAACPTGALVGPGELDARRCLAWLVQAPGVFPREYREALGDRLYGCDDCQTSCPVNRLATHRHPPPEAERDAQRFVDVLWMLEASDEELMDALGRWYVPRREARYLRRNALIVLGNTGDPADPAVIDALERALKAADPIVRAHAVWAASRLGRPQLLRPLRDDRDPLVAAELAAAGGSENPPKEGSSLRPPATGSHL